MPYMKRSIKNNLSTLPVSILDLALVLEGKTPGDSFKTSLDLARKAEQLGYTRYWLAEHHNMESVASSATVVLIGYIAGGTTTLRVGSGGIMLPNHAPLIVAEQFGTLASLYPGRIDLGLGRAPGTDQLTAMALRRDQRAVMEFPENIREIQTYLSVENRNSKVRAIPGEGTNIPIWILGSSTDSAYLASALGLPYAFASHFAPAQLFTALSIYRKNFKPSAQLQEPYVMPCINVVAADTDEEAELLATSSKRLFLGIITGERKLLQKPDKNFFLSEMEEAALKQMTAYSFVGSPGKLKEQLQIFADQTGADEIMIVSHIYDHEARVYSYELIRQLQQS
jgi:luciferase family oxidoreductase group 1